MFMSSSSDEEDDAAADDEWRGYHERCCQEGDGWTHGFNTFEWGDHWCNPKKREGGDGGLGGQNPDLVTFVHEPKQEVIRYFENENWLKMGDSMSHNMSLKYVDLSQCGLTAGSIKALFGEQRSYDNCPLEKLDLGKNDLLGSDGMTAFLFFLKSRLKLTYLNLSGTNLDAEGARLLSEALNHVRIEYLHVRDNAIGDGGLESLLLADNAKHLVELSLVENVIGPRGYDAVSQFLQRGDDTDLKKLLMNCDSGDSAKMIVDSISNKSKLEDLFLWSGTVGRDNVTVIAALPNIQSLVCNTTSPELLCQSNTQMKWLGINTDSILQSNSSIKKALDINARSMYGASRVNILRHKLITFYFQGEYCVHPFAKMNVKLMPKVLELVTKTEVCVDKKDGYLGFGSGTYSEACSDNIGAVYRLVRNCHMPELFSYKVDSKIMACLEKSDLGQNNEQLTMMENDDLRHESSTLPNKRKSMDS